MESQMLPNDWSWHLNIMAFWGCICNQFQNKQTRKWDMEWESVSLSLGGEAFPTPRQFRERGVICALSLSADSSDYEEKMQMPTAPWMPCQHVCGILNNNDTCPMWASLWNNDYRLVSVSLATQGALIVMVIKACIEIYLYLQSRRK